MLTVLVCIYLGPRMDRVGEDLSALAQDGVYNLTPQARILGSLDYTTNNQQSTKQALD